MTERERQRLIGNERKRVEERRKERERVQEKRKERERVQERRKEGRKISGVYKYTILIYNFEILSVNLATIVVVIVEIVLKVAAYDFLLQVVIIYFSFLKFQFGGFIAFECKIRGDSPMVVRALRESDHKVAMLTGRKNVFEIQIF